MYVKIIKLMSGEELIATVDFMSPTELSIKNVLAIVLVQGQTPGAFSHRLIPWCDSVENSEYSINRKAVVFEGTPNEDILNAYNAQFQVITTPPPRSLLLVK